MKKTKIIYWLFTGPFAAMMLFSAIPDIMNTPETVDFMSTKLGYPGYFTPFIGIAKVLGVIAILIPGYPRIKEWAYAGLVFDLVGATYSMFSIGPDAFGTVFMLVMITIAFGSYFYYHRLARETGKVHVGA